MTTTLPRALATWAAVVLGPWALVLALVAALLAAPPAVPEAEAAPVLSTRFVNVRDVPRGIDVGIGARGGSLVCLSIATGRAPAVVSVSIGRTVVLDRYRVAAHRETGCVAGLNARTRRHVTVPRGAYVYTRPQAGAPARRTRLP